MGGSTILQKYSSLGTSTCIAFNAPTHKTATLLQQCYFSFAKTVITFLDATEQLLKLRS